MMPYNVMLGIVTSLYKGCSVVGYVNCCRLRQRWLLFIGQFNKICIMHQLRMKQMF